MRSYAAYVRAGRAPLLLEDRFRAWAFLFGPLWLLAHAAFIPAALLFALEIVLGASLHGTIAVVTGLGVAWLVGLHAQDLRGWSLARHGWRLAHVVAARDRESAYARLLSGHPELQDAAARA